MKGQMVNAYLQLCNIILKFLRKDACLHAAERTFQNLALLNKKHSVHFLKFLCGLRSVEVFLRFPIISTQAGRWYEFLHIQLEGGIESACKHLMI